MVSILNNFNKDFSKNFNADIEKLFSYWKNFIKNHKIMMKLKIKITASKK
jgi:hypothetical protein